MWSAEAERALPDRSFGSRNCDFPHSNRDARFQLAECFTSLLVKDRCRTRFPANLVLLLQGLGLKMEASTRARSGW